MEYYLLIIYFSLICMSTNLYLMRNENLSALGFKSYSEYLQSDLWKRIRSQVLNSTTSCWTCDNPPNQVHHWSYRPSVLKGEELGKLVALCSGCHAAIEFAGKRKILDLRTVNARLGRRRARYLRSKYF